VNLIDRALRMSHGKAQHLCNRDGTDSATHFLTHLHDCYLTANRVFLLSNKKTHCNQVSKPTAMTHALIVKNNYADARRAGVALAR
jgi:hypothetical protein